MTSDLIQLTEEDTQKAAANYHNWQRTGHDKNYKDIPEFCYSANIGEIEKNGFSLIPSKYIEFVDRDSNINFDKEMKRIQKEFQALLADEVGSQKELINAFKGLGYEIKL